MTAGKVWHADKAVETASNEPTVMILEKLVIGSEYFAFLSIS
jgi:hypothetical protein